MGNQNFEGLMSQGLKAMHEGDTLLAMIHFEDAARLKSTPMLRSCLAYCFAKEKKLYSKAIVMCMGAKNENPEKSLHYLNLGRIYLLAGHKRSAIAVFRQGLKMERNAKIIAELKKLGLRKPPPLASLAREHFLNRVLGKCLTATQMR